MTVDRDDWPVHQPAAPDAPIPGRHWYAGCDPDQPRVGPDGICEGCGEVACPECGRENCSEHADAASRAALLALVRWLGKTDVSLPVDLHAQVRKALGDDFLVDVD